MTEGGVGDDKRNGLLKHCLQLRGSFDDFSLGVDCDEGGGSLDDQPLGGCFPNRVGEGDGGFSGCRGHRFDVEGLAVMRRRAVEYFRMGDQKVDALLLEFRDRDSVCEQVFGPRPFKIFEVVGVIHHAAAVGVLIINFDVHWRYNVIFGNAGKLGSVTLVSLIAAA